jgi:predicted nuclease of restriction endonuclease-like (RecB) superfamily
MVYTYYEIGRMIVGDEQHGKECAEYGKQVLKELSKNLTKNFGKGFSVENLDRMRFFYKTYMTAISSTVLTKLENSKNQKVNSTIQQTDSAELQKKRNDDITNNPQMRKFSLSWSHYLKLMRVENPNERNFYEIESAANNWSLKELQRQVDSALYQRLSLSRDKEGVKQLAQKGQVIENPLDIIKDPYILEFLNLPEQRQYSENDLKTAIIDKLAHFLLELGKGFTFVGRQVRFTFDEKHYKVDLVFFNRLLKCFVVLDLKIGELTHQDLGQIQMYVNYYDRFVRLADENKTIGIVLCKDKNDSMVEITLPKNNNSIFASPLSNYLTR